MSPRLLLLCERSAATLLESIWHAALLLMVIAIALRLLPRLTAAVRSLIWTAALIVIVGLPFLPVPAAQTFAHAFSHADLLRLNPAWSLAIAALWIALSSFRAQQLILGGIRLRQTWKDAKPVGSRATACVELRFGLRRFCIKRSATLCLSGEVARPSVIGFFSPRILVPCELYPKLSAGEIDQIVIHEMEHLRRGDDWRNLLQKLAVTVFPLNPALLWIERRLCFERELACDESVLEQTQAPRSYAACLVHLAEASRFGRQLSLALGAWERRSELGRRVHGILASRTQAAVAPRLRNACAAILLSGMVALALTLARAPQLISFANIPTANATMADAHVASAPSAAFHNARLSTAFPSAPKMVETMMRIPATSLAPTKVHTKATRAPRPRTIAALPAPPPRIMVTSWSYSGATGTVRIQRVTFAVFQVSSSSEAAVPATSSLFILQL